VVDRDQVFDPAVKADQFRVERAAPETEPGFNVEALFPNEVGIAGLAARIDHIEFVGGGEPERRADLTASVDALVAANPARDVPHRLGLSIARHVVTQTPREAEVSA